MSGWKWLRRPEEGRAGDGYSRVAIGQTAFGRHLKVIYVPDAGGDSAFVITAYDIRPKARKAFRRRQRRKGQ